MNNNLEFSIKDSDVAVIGLAGRFPGAKNIQEFWQLLIEGKEGIRKFSDYELRVKGIDDAILSKSNYIKSRGIIDDIENFPADFFGIHPKEAFILDPQHRIFLELSWEALESAGYTSDKTNAVISVFAGASDNTYLENILKKNKLIKSSTPYQLALANSNHFLATKISYYLNLKGVSVNINTACSTSLVAIIMACQSILSGETDIALAGGICVRVPQEMGYFYQEGSIYSRDGHCRAFDKNASGIVSSNGAGVVVLKRLKQAIKDRDHIHAVIKSFSINNDGAIKSSFAAPSMLEQSRCIATALSIIDVETVNYVEAHGTGTYVGDPIEVDALTKAFRFYTQKEQFCAIGSVKTNIGHTDTASGVAGFIKTILCLKNKLLVPSLHYNEANPNIKFNKSPFYINTKLTEWNSSYSKLRAGVSSFGIGGTNAHIIIEEAPLICAADHLQSDQIIILSAKNELDLQNQKLNLLNYLKCNNDIQLKDLAYTLQVGRKDFAIRDAYLCSDMANLNDLLTSDVINNQLKKHTTNRSIIFLLDHAHHNRILPGMAADLYHDNLFKIILDKHTDSLPSDIQQAVLHYLVTSNHDIVDSRLIKNISIFLFQYTLAECLLNLNVKPKLSYGNGMGALAILVLTGILSLKDALFFIIDHTNRDINSDIDILYNKVRLTKNYLAPKIQYLLSTADEFNSLNKNTFISIMNEYSSLSNCDNLDKILNNNNLYIDIGVGDQIKTKLGQKNIRNIFSNLNPDGNPLKLNNFYELIIRLWLDGQSIDWKNFQNLKNNKRLQLPTYPFTKQYCWINNLLNTRENANPAALIYTSQWVVSQISTKQVTDNVLFIIFCKDEHLIKNFKYFESAIFVFFSDHFEKINSNQYYLNPSNEKEYKLFFDNLILPSRTNIILLYCWELDTNHEKSGTRLNKIPTSKFMRLVNLIKALDKLNQSNNILFYCFTNKLYKILENDSIIPQKHYLNGLLLTISQEYRILTRIIDIDILTEKMLINEIHIDDDITNHHIAYRNGVRYVKQYKQILKNNNINTDILKHKGFYLLIGGLGKIGIELANALAKKYAANLVLTNRLGYLDISNTNTASVSEIENKITEIRTYASSLWMKKLDVTDFQQIKYLINDLKNSNINFDGIFHLAGNINQSAKIFIKNIESTQVDYQFFPKIFGAYACKYISQKLNVNYCIFISSLSSIIGGVGLAAYSSANSIIDAFINKQNKYNKTQWITLNLDAYRTDSVSIIDEALKIKPISEQMILSHADLHKRINKNVNSNTVILSKQTPINIFDHCKSILTDSFKSCLGLSTVHENDDFFTTLNGDSISAISLLEEVNAKFRINLKISDLIRHPTIISLSKMISHVANDVDSRCLIKLSEFNNNKPFLFLIHPVGGTVFCYRELVKKLNNTFNCYGIQDPAIDYLDYIPYQSLREMSTLYLNEIRKIQTTNPYYLVGYSYGGNICYEIANQLSKQEKCHLFLIDSWASVSADLKNYNMFKKTMEKTIAQLELPIMNNTNYTSRLLNLSWERMQLMFNYNPPKLDIPLILFKAMEILPEYTMIDQKLNHWSMLTKNRIDVYQVEGNHKTLLEYPGVETISSIINNFIMK